MTTLGATPSTTTFPATAADVPFVPAGTIAATNVQTAIEEVAAAVGTLTTEQFAGDGIEDTFTLTQTPMSGYAIVTVNGAQVTTYTITGDDVVFDTPPDDLAEILVNYVYGGGLAAAMYAAGTDRFSIVAGYQGYDVLFGNVDPVDWRGIDGGDADTPGPPLDPFVTRIGDIFDLDHLESTGQLKFLTDGVYDVQVHFTQGIGVDAETKLVLINEVADGSDVFNPAAATIGPTLGYVWSHAVDDIVVARVDFPAPPGPLTFNVFCQVVKLSEVAAIDEFDPAYSGDLSDLTA